MLKDFFTQEILFTGEKENAYDGLMKKLQVMPSVVSGSVKIPPSKSQTLRALVFAAVAKGRSTITSVLDSPDVRAMVEACRMIGARVEISGKRLVVDGTAGQVVLQEGATLDVGNSGLTLRLMTALMALGNKEVTITGDHSIQTQRPMGPLIVALSSLGARCEGLFAPFTLQGPIKPGKVTVDGKDSQPVTALLIAAALMPGATEITIVNRGEWPWVELTLYWFDKLQISYEVKDDGIIVHGGDVWEGFDYVVPGDMSSMAFPLAAAAITGGSVTIEGVNLQDPQGDGALVAILEKMGAQFKKGEGELTILSRTKLQGIEIDVNDVIDALPILSVIATAAEGTTRLFNGAVAREKECDRIKESARILKAMGAFVEERVDGLIIKKSALQGAAMHSAFDHRIAMAAAVAALVAGGASTIEETACIAKTYPDFARQFQQMGAHIQEVTV